MTQRITFQLPPYGVATLTLPESLSPDAFARLDSAIGDALCEPLQQRGPDSPGDPGAIEFDSWLIHRH